MKTEQPACKTLYPWLRANLGNCLGGLTGTDRKALDAAVQVIVLYSYHSTDDVARAFGLIVRMMQPYMRFLAYHAIAHVMEWETRDKLWHRAGLPAADAGAHLCAFEQGGAKR